MNWQKIRTHIVMVTGSQLLQKADGIPGDRADDPPPRRAAEMGSSSWRSGIGTIAAQATELGTSRHIIRTVARNHAGALEELSRALSLRLPVMACVFLLVNLAVPRSPTGDVGDPAAGHDLPHAAGHPVQLRRLLQRTRAIWHIG